LSLSTVSHHLKELRNAGLIVCQKRGQWVHCAPNGEILKQVRDFVSR
jgi:DNA-binding transcriptional ArsR family regulator